MKKCRVQGCLRLPLSVTLGQAYKNNWTKMTDHCDVHYWEMLWRSEAWRTAI